MRSSAARLLAALLLFAGCDYDQPRPKPPGPPTREARRVSAPAVPTATDGAPPQTRKSHVPGEALVVLPTFEVAAPSPGATPRLTYDAVKFCVARADYMGVWGLFSKRARGEADGGLPPAIGEWRYFNRDGFIQLFGKTPMQFEKLPIPEQYALLSLRAHRAKSEMPKVFIDSTFVSEAIDGDTAKVTYRRPDGTTTFMKLVREDGAWKLARTRF